MSFIAGKYAITLGASSVGQTGLDSVKVEHQVFKQLIVGDNFAETPQDAVFRGMAEFLEFIMIEYNATAARAAFWPYGSAYGTMDTVIGTLDQSNAAQIIMTALTGTPAAAAPTTLTAPKCILAEGYPVSLLFAPRLREIPVRMRIYPNTSGVFHTLT